MVIGGDGEIINLHAILDCIDNSGDHIIAIGGFSSTCCLFSPISYVDH